MEEVLGVVPTVHYVITDGVVSLFEEGSFHWLLLMATLYLVGALLYATRTPERFFPGKCDIWVSFQVFFSMVFKFFENFRIHAYRLV